MSWPHTLARRVLTEGKVLGGQKITTGVEVADGRENLARREFILSACAYHIPQILLLPGVGPAADLERHGITLTINAPKVGKCFHDH